MSGTALIGILVVVFWLIFKCVMVIPEGTVVQTFRLGKPHKSFSSGLHIGWFDLLKKISLKPGVIGTATSEDTLEIEGHQINVRYASSPRIGSAARIEKFEGVVPVVTQVNVPDERLVKCEKCGHTNKVRV